VPPCQRLGIRTHLDPCLVEHALHNHVIVPGTQHNLSKRDGQSRAGALCCQAAGVTHLPRNTSTMNAPINCCNDDTTSLTLRRCTSTINMGKRRFRVRRCCEHRMDANPAHGYRAVASRVSDTSEMLAGSRAWSASSLPAVIVVRGAWCNGKITNGDDREVVGNRF
jgi:hypothetical protein